MISGPKTDFYYYFVAAAHVVQRSEQYGTLYIRINMQNDTVEDIPTDPSDWVISDALESDVAVNWKTEAPLQGWDHRMIPVEALADDEFVQTQSISPGDSLFSVGLFVPQPGNPRMLPICRFGNISTIPQSLTTQLLGPASAGVNIIGYLTEWRSSGGASGSPAFVYFPPDRTPRHLASSRWVKPS